MGHEVNDIERYVRRATRGLPTAARRAAQTELRGHLTERRLELQASGLSEVEASRQALRELGQADELNTQFVRVHAVPVMTRSAATLALFVTLAVSTPPPDVGARGGHVTAAPAASQDATSLARPYVPGTARPIPIPRCFDARLILLGTKTDGVTLHEGRYRCPSRTAARTPPAR